MDGLKFKKGRTLDEDSNKTKPRQIEQPRPWPRMWVWRHHHLKYSMKASRLGSPQQEWREWYWLWQEEVPSQDRQWRQRCQYQGGQSDHEGWMGRTAQTCHGGQQGQWLGWWGWSWEECLRAMRRRTNTRTQWTCPIATLHLDWGFGYAMWGTKLELLLGSALVTCSKRKTCVILYN